MTSTLLLIATPYNPTLELSLDGLPPAAGTSPAGEEITFEARGGEETVYLADTVGYRTSPNDFPPSQPFEARLSSSFNVQASAWSGREPDGRARVSFGDIQGSNADGRFDPQLLDGWDGRIIELLQGDSQNAFSSFNRVFLATSDGLAWDLDQFVIRLRDRQFLFENDIHQQFYGGSGGLDGTEELEGQGIPLCYGECFNVPAVAEDPTQLIYRVHFTSIEAIDEIRVGGVANPIEADTTDIVSANPTAGKAVTDLSTGRFKLGSNPSGSVRADVRGDNVGGYVNTTADIVRRIVTRQLGAINNLSDPGSLDTASFSQLNTDAGQVVGYFVDTSEETSSGVINALLSGVSAYRYFTRLGSFGVKQLKLPDSPIDTITEADIDASRELRRTGPPRPFYKRRALYARNWGPQSRGELAGTVSEADVADFTRRPEDGPFASSSDPNIQVKHRLAPSRDQDSYFRNQAEAKTFADQQLALHGELRSEYTVPLRPDALFKYWLGDEITLKIPRFGLDAGQDFVIKGIEENARSRRVTITVWG